MPSRYRVGEASLVAREAAGELPLGFRHRIATLGLGHAFLGGCRFLRFRLFAAGTFGGFGTGYLLGDEFLDLAVQSLGLTAFFRELGLQVLAFLIQLGDFLLLVRFFGLEFLVFGLAFGQESLFLCAGFLQFSLFQGNLVLFVHDRCSLHPLPLGILPQVSHSAQRLGKIFSREDEQQLVERPLPPVEALHRLPVVRFLLAQFFLQFVDFSLHSFHLLVDSRHLLRQEADDLLSRGDLLRQQVEAVQRAFRRRAGFLEQLVRQLDFLQSSLALLLELADGGGGLGVGRRDGEED